MRPANAAGFGVVLYHVNVANLDICLACVRCRAYKGGDDVPEDRGRARYERNKAHILDAARIADEAIVFDSSKLGIPARLVSRLDHGVVPDVAEDVPEWAATRYEV